MNKPSDAALAVPLWIGGKPAGSASSRSGDVTNPATGAITKRVPFCNAADIDAAVKAAAAALPEWSACAAAAPRADPAEVPAADAGEREGHRARWSREEHGKTLADAMGSVQRGIEVVEFACGIPHLLKGEYSENVGPGVDMPHAAPAGRRVRGDHAVQFSGDGAAVDVPGRARRAATRSS